MVELFPFRKDFTSGEFAYVVPLTFGRARLVTATPDDPWGVLDGW